MRDGSRLVMDDKSITPNMFSINRRIRVFITYVPNKHLRFSSSRTTDVCFFDFENKKMLMSCC